MTARRPWRKQTQPRKIVIRAVERESPYAGIFVGIDFAKGFREQAALLAENMEHIKKEIAKIFGIEEGAISR